jgi:succinate dehydrogenase flavin-adding protein (antitoxin of CptAB toxin-antitoxin module)
MFKLDNDFLVSLGLGALPPEEKNKMLAHIYDTLEMRVGMKLAEQMSEQQLSDFEKLIDSNDESGALKWLETNFPNYKQVVADELEKLKSEISSVAPQILASSGVDPNSPPPTQSPAANSESSQPTTPTN